MIFGLLNNKTLNFNIPTSWNDMNEYQRIKVSDLVFNSKDGDTSIYFYALYYLFVPMSWKSWRGIKSLKNFLTFIQNVPASEWRSYVQFIFEKLELHKFPKFVKIDGVKYYGPADRLSNLSIDELNFAYKFYFDWITTKDIAALDRLITVIYRPANKKKRGDIRELFDKEEVIKRGTVFPKLPLDQKIAIGLAFKGSVDYMFSKFPVLFPPSKENKTNSKPKYQSLVPMINAMFMYENQPLGSRSEVIKTNAYVFFDVAQETVLAAKKREAEFKKRK